MPKNRWLRRARGAAVVALVGAGLQTALAVPASAASYGWDYISLPTSLNNCPSGGSVKYMQIMIGDTWSGGDYGDDLVYGKVLLNADQQVVGQGLCYNGKKSYWGPAFSQTIHPRRSNQTWWVGPRGVRHN